MLLIKLLMLVRYILGQVILALSLLIRAIFRIIFFRPLVKLYYLVFRLKKSGVVDTSLERTIRRNLGSFLVLALLAIIIGIDILANKAGTDTGKLSQTIIASLIKNEFSSVQEEELIAQGPMSSGDILPERYFSPQDSLKRPSENWKEDSQTEGGWLTLSLIKDSGVVTGSRSVSLAAEQVPIEPGQVMPTKRTETITYTVAAGDTISGIARRFGININTVLWSNNLSAYSLIKPGDKLAILPVSGWIYKVKSGDVMGRLASTYGVSVEQIIEANNLESASLKIGQSIIIPGDKPTVSTGASQVAGGTSRPQTPVTTPSVPGQAAEDAGGKMVWPTVGHRITQYYSLKHTGLDIANKVGTPVYAAEAGTVTYSGWSTGYGYNVVIDHSNGYKTRYAHSSNLEVSVGDKVSRGQEIMKMGSTGWSTGPHLHFEVIISGSRKNPLNYIK